MSQSDIRSLDISMIRTFDALMRERSVSRAAARLFLSQPAVSASLARLRKIFNDPLFIRTGHGVSPTPKAQRLAPKIEKALFEFSSLFDEEQDFSPSESSRIFRIAGSDHPSNWVLPALGRILAASGSAIRIVWEPVGSLSLQDSLSRGELDMALIARMKPPVDLQHLVLYEDNYVYALRRDHPGASEQVSLDSFCEIPQIFLGYGTSTLDDRIDDILAATGRKRKVQMVVSSFAQIIHQLEHSDYAAVMGQRVALTHADKLVTQALPFALPNYSSFLCWDKKSVHDPGIQWLKNQILAIAGQNPRVALAPKVRL
jgi:DNA-binding transcriptional LysR family regulator